MVILNILQRVLVFSNASKQIIKKIELPGMESEWHSRDWKNMIKLCQRIIFCIDLY